MYFVLFVNTFGKMVSTSLDGSEHKSCIQYAKAIKFFSALVLLTLVTYHVFRFEFLNLNKWYKDLKDSKSFFVLYLSIFGFSEDEKGTKISVQQYTTYLIVG